MTNIDLVEKAILAANSKTIYIQGCFGDPLTSDAVKNHHIKRFANYKRKDAIMRASNDTFGFDCVCLVKGILWGWNGDVEDPHGGAVYLSNNMGDVTTEFMEILCNASEDFSRLEVGELLFMPGHVGIYIGSGRAVECTPKWDGGVQYSDVANMGVTGVKSRTWKSHGKIPCVEYVTDNFTISLPVVRKGVKSDYVRNIQRLLIARGYSCGRCGDDGSFGGDTVKSVKEWQRNTEIPETGEIGERELKLLLGV